MKAEIRKKYEDVIRPQWLESRGLKNIYEVPMVTKIVLNMGLGRHAQDKKMFEAAVDGLTKLSGQAPVVTKAKKSIAGFKVREHMILGLKVTLRGVRMDEFMERLVNVAMPRIRDFRGLSGKSFDGRGNFSFGIKDYAVFPEIHYDERVTGELGLDVAICTTAKTNADAKALLECLNFPFYE
jgi:large subunit ribosomal protein L5